MNWTRSVNWFRHYVRQRSHRQTDRHTHTHTQTFFTNTFLDSESNVQWKIIKKSKSKILTIVIFPSLLMSLESKNHSNNSECERKITVSLIPCWNTWISSRCGCRQSSVWPCDLLLSCNFLASSRAPDLLILLHQCGISCYRLLLQPPTFPLCFPPFNTSYTTLRNVTFSPKSNFSFFLFIEE